MQSLKFEKAVVFPSGSCVLACDAVGACSVFRGCEHVRTGAEEHLNAF